MKHLFKILCVLSLMITACNKAGDKESNRTTDQQEQSHQRGGSEVNQTKEVDLQQAAPRRRKESTSFLNNKTLLLAIISLCVAFIASVVAVTALVKLRYLNLEISELEEKVRKHSLDRSNVQRNTNLNSRDIEPLVDNALDRRIGTIVDQVQECLRLNNQEKYGIISNQTPNQTLNQSKSLYASSADKNSNSFFSVAEQPNTKSIYRLDVDSSSRRAEFRVYEAAYSKVINFSDFLQCASELTKLGNTTVENISPGIAEKDAEGRWKIVQKAKVKFV